MLTTGETFVGRKVQNAANRRIQKEQVHQDFPYFSAMTLSRRPLVATRFAIARTVRTGDLVVDATVGNGYDTAYLARLVGRSGRVIGFDVQEEAIRNTTARLTAQGLIDRVSLRHKGHEFLVDEAGIRDNQGIRCATFNLGYLPGSDKSVITRPGTSLTAIRAACSQLLRFGLVTIMVYPGHTGGREEAEAIDDFCAGLANTSCASNRFHVMSVHSTDRSMLSHTPVRPHPYAYHVYRGCRRPSAFSK